MSNKFFDNMKGRINPDKVYTFSEFHAMMTKAMPDVNHYPQMYNLCYDLMRLAWDTAKQSERNKE